MDTTPPPLYVSPSAPSTVDPESLNNGDDASLTPVITPAVNAPSWLRIGKYLLTALVANGALWGSTINFLKTTVPVYTSDFVVHVAGQGLGVNLNLPDIGQAATSSSSPFSSSADPRENYKLLALGHTVLDNAAAAMSLTPEEFGQPTIDLIPNTTTLGFETEGDSPEIARRKGEILFQTLERRLNTLRLAEHMERDQAISEAVTEAQKKLTIAQKQLSNYKARSGLTSSEQITNLIDTIETLRKQQAEKVALSRQVGDRLRTLSTSVELLPKQAASALLLQTDQQFQKSLAEYTTTTTALNALLKDRGPNYPDVVDLRNKQQAALNTVLTRGKALLGQTVTLTDIERLNLDNTNSSGVKRGELFQQLITEQADYQGLLAEIKSLSQQIKALEQRLKVLVQKESVLDNYLRELQIAEAVFTSTLAKVDLGKSDPFGSYPLVQLVEPPSLPTEPSAPRKKLVIMGAGLGSIFITAGLTLLWWRKEILVIGVKVSQKILA